MKKSFNKITVLFLVIVVAGASCKKTIFPAGINTDPNASTKDHLLPNVVLPGAEYSLAYTIGGDVSRFSSVIMQSVTGSTRQFGSYNNYIFTAQDFDNVWSNFYTQGLNNLFTLNQISEPKGYYHYAGIAKILMAYGIGTVTDLWGDVPYSQAFRGDSSVLQPAYDNQQAIYDSIFSLLSQARTDLAADASLVEPGDDDFIYGGDLTKWIKLSYALEARYYLHLSKVDASYADKALASLANGLTSNDDNASVPFYDDGTEANPWYQYVSQRNDITYTDSYLYGLMSSKSDPRSDLFIDPSNGIGSAIGDYDAPVYLMTYAEQKFIEAEALSAKGDAGAATAYNDAVTANFTTFGLSAGDATTYLAANALTGVDHAARLSQIIEQKYIALFSEPEPWVDYRRTGYPALTPTAGSNIPRRFIYVQAELSNNTANVPTGTTLFSKVWWDQ